MTKPNQQAQRALICEGECNPGIAALDAEVVVTRERMTSAGHEQLSDPVLLAALNRLRHTRHTAVNNDETMFACNDCGTRRQYGGNYSLVL